MAESKRKRALVIVESPAKAKKIAGFLGPDFEVRASMGHVRDLPEKAADIPEEFKSQPWSNLGVDVTNQFAPLYVVSPQKKKVVQELKTLLKNADELILATDEDREGESIGWHLAELLQPKVPVKRMVFSEITKKAILDALNHTRKLDMSLVEAQETRRVLDRLYGYTLSPLLWKKVRRGLSAGRVQSVAVRVLVHRELERLAFRSGTYWDLKAQLQDSPQNEPFEAMLVRYQGQQIATGKDFDEHTGKIKDGANVLLIEEDLARRITDSLKNAGSWNVSSVEERPQKRQPAAPFTTSTLQQEANRKLGMSSRETMQVAQRLYEDGHITYMRTDSVTLSQEAINAARDRIQRNYGSNYVTPQPRIYATKTKNAQEAHEAIRPSGTDMATSDELGLSGREQKLYDLIWKRTIASQMADAQFLFRVVTIQSGEAEFRATDKEVVFDGFIKAYSEGSDDALSPDELDTKMPLLKQGDSLRCKEIVPLSHETKPPARYTEASLVRKLEQEGIGRPSTYASIIGTIQDRGYARKAGNQLIPTFTALAVNKLLESYFPRLVDLQFTAQMEQSLDDISNGQAERLPYLEKFYAGEEGLDNQVKAKEESIDPREACTLRIDGLNSAVRVGKYGPYLESQKDGETLTASLPDDVSPADLNNEVAEKLITLKQQGPRSLGLHPDDGKPIYVLSGPFGPYLQLGEVSEDGTKPKRVSIPKGIDPLALDFDMAMKYLELPRRVGLHPEDGKVVNAGIGRFGPYVQHAGKYKSLGKEDDVLTIDRERAVELLKEVRAKTAPTPLKELGEHPEDGEKIAIFEGRYGPYVKCGKINATLPKGTDIDAVTLAEAVGLIDAKAGQKGGAKKSVRKKAGSTKGAAAKKTSEKKAPRKKAAKKKTAEAE